MTTLDLIEKYGIGHNCLSDAYALGMMHGLDGMEGAARLAEEKARVDAIEDCISIVDKCLIDLPVTHDKTINALCQLKEKKNG